MTRPRGCRAPPPACAARPPCQGRLFPRERRTGIRLRTQPPSARTPGCRRWR
uniref:Uncharacterized protein n=1 Tax=Arundo donax TaxID=35708 RepID=A0A0A8YPW1_ARUDO